MVLGVLEVLGVLGVLGVLRGTGVNIGAPLPPRVPVPLVPLVPVPIVYLAPLALLPRGVHHVQKGHFKKVKVRRQAAKPSQIRVFD